MKDFDFLRKANLKARKWALALTNSKLNRAFALAKRDGLGFRFVTLAELCFAVKVN
ncbi:hypothetical protein ACX6CE_001601 [Campylobacter upsaliensis]